MSLSPPLRHSPSISGSLTQQNEEIIEVLKGFLHQNNLSLYCSQNQDTQTLLDAIADNLSIKRYQLHNSISKMFKKMLAEQNLPKKLMYVYSDPQIVDQYSRDPQLVSFYKITYELVCAIYDVKLVIYTLIERSDKSFLLNAMIVNPKGSQRHIQVARISNKFYRVQEQFHQMDQFSMNSLHSFPSARSSNNLNSQEKEENQFTRMRQPFKSEQIIVDLQSEDMIRKPRKLSPDYVSNTEDDVNGAKESFFTTKLIKHSSKYEEKDFIKNQSMVSDYGDDVSLGSILDKQQEKDLLNKCSNIGKQAANTTNQTNPRNLVHQNNHMPGANYSPDMMYYYYMPHQPTFGSQAYPGKSEPYLPYAGHSVSPTKNHNKLIQINASNSPVKSTHPFTPIYPTLDPISTTQPVTTPQTTVQTPSLPPLEIKQSQRYKGRLKFFDEGKNYGFIIMDADESDLFVHFDDLQKAGITKQKLKTYKQNQGYMQVKFTFKVMEYFGKYRQSRKAVQLEAMEAP